MLSRSSPLLRRYLVNNFVHHYYQRFCSTALLNKEYEVTFYSRPFGLDLKFNELNDEISIERSAWKDIKIDSILYKINDVELNECINDHDDDHDNKFKSIIKHLQVCSLPAKISFKSNINDNNVAIDMKHFLLPINKPFSSMDANEFIDYLQLNYSKQIEIYNKYNSNDIFCSKYPIFISLMNILSNTNIDWNRLKGIHGINDDGSNNLSNFNVNQSIIKSRIASSYKVVKQQKIERDNDNQTQMHYITTALNEPNFEQMDRNMLFNVIFCELFYDDIITHIFAQNNKPLNDDIKKTNIRKYLIKNKKDIFNKLHDTINTYSNEQSISELFTNRNKIFKFIEKYFESNYHLNIRKDFKTDKFSIEKEAEYWLIVTIFYDILFYPFDNEVHKVDLKRKSELNNFDQKSNYILYLNHDRFLLHNYNDLIQSVRKNDNIEYVAYKPAMKSLIERFKFYKFRNLSDNDIQLKIQRYQASSGSGSAVDNDYSSGFGLGVNLDNVNNDNIDIFINHLSYWIYNIIEILRLDDNVNNNLSSYLINERPQDLITNNSNKINKMNKSKFIEFINQKLSEISSDDSDEFNKVINNNRDNIINMISDIQWNNDNQQDNIDQICNTMRMATNIDINDSKLIINWLYSVINEIQRIETPIFDKMMERRNLLRNSLLSNDDDDDKGNNIDILPEFDILRKNVDKQLREQKKPVWNQYNDDFEKEFVDTFLHSKGFGEYTDKFVSMSSLSKFKNREFRKTNLCAKYRKQIKRHVNKWCELQNIIKYGSKPYYRSNGYNKTSIPSTDQVYGEVKYIKRPHDENEITKSFYVPFTNYSDLYQMVKYRDFSNIKNNLMYK